MRATIAARFVQFAICAALLAPSATRAQTPTLLAEEAEGTVEVGEERRVVVSGLHGEIVLRGGPAGFLSFQGKTRDGARSPAPVAIWLDGDTFRIGPAQSGQERPLSLVVGVPPELLVEVEAAASTVGLSGVPNTVRVRGAGLDTQVDWCTGRVFLELEGGSVRATQMAGEIEIQGRATIATVHGGSGRVSLRLAGSRAELRAVGGVEGETEGTLLEIDGTHGPVRLSARAGEVRAKNIFLGGSFRMSGAPLSVRQARGQLEIESDAEVRLAETDSVRVSGMGAKVSATLNAVSFELHADGGSATLEKLGGSATVSGSGLDLTLWHVAAAKIDVSSSQLRLDGADGPLEVSGDGSDLRIVNPAQEVTIRTRGGSLQVLEMMGPAQIQAETELIEVSWGAQLLAKSSSVRNDGGSIAVVLPASVSCRVEAESRYGRIESDLPGIEVSTEGTRAAGVLGHANQSVLLRVVAERDVTLSTRRTPE